MACDFLKGSESLSRRTCGISGPPFQFLEGRSLANKDDKEKSNNVSEDGKKREQEGGNRRETQAKPTPRLFNCVSHQVIVLVEVFWGGVLSAESKEQMACPRSHSQEVAEPAVSWYSWDTPEGTLLPLVWAQTQTGSKGPPQPPACWTFHFGSASMWNQAYPLQHDQIFRNCPSFGLWNEKRRARK